MPVGVSLFSGLAEITQQDQKAKTLVVLCRSVCVLCVWVGSFGSEDLASPFGEDRGFREVRCASPVFEGGEFLALCRVVSRVPARPPRMSCVFDWLWSCGGASAMPSGVWCTASRVHCILRTCGPGAARA